MNAHKFQEWAVNLIRIYFQFSIKYFKNNLMLFKEQINLCDKSQKLNDLTRVTLAAFVIPLGCPIVANYVNIFMAW